MLERLFNKLLVVGLLAVFSQSAMAQPREGWSFSLTDENDVFDFIGENSDRYFTQGFKFGVLCPIKNNNFLCGLGENIWPLNEVENDNIRTTFGFGQHIFTPEDLTLINPDPKDRPYAGWAYVSVGALTSTDTELQSLEFQLGVIGPSARAGEAQNNFHDLIKTARSLGWDHQLNDEVAVNLYHEHRWRQRPYHPNFLGNANLEFDYIPTFTAAVGTVEVSVGGGVTGRVGFNLDGDFGPPRLRPSTSASEFFESEKKWGVYAFIGLHGRAVARDIFLDGNTWQNSATVARRVFIPEATVGFAFRREFFRFGYTYIWRGEEFFGQNGPLEYGSINATLSYRR